MASIYVRHTVEDYAAWKAAFDENRTTRQAAGGRGGVVYRDADNPNQITTILEWDNLDNARRFAQSDELREAMKEAGVTSQPDVRFLNGSVRVSE